MQKHFAIAAIACIFSNSCITGQSIQPLAVGSTVGFNKNVKLINNHDTLLNISGLKEPLVILDFWATWCTTCIAKFPHLDSLQQRFAGKIKILLINWDEDSDRINPFLKKYASRNKRALSLPIVVGDTVLRTLFPHQSIPHYVWIHNGRLLATTGPDMVDERRIDKLLQGQPVSFKMKRDVMDFDDNKFLFEDDNGATVDRQLYRSVFSRELEGVRAGTRFKRDSATQRRMYINLPVVKLYQLAAGFDLNRLVLEVPEPLKYAGTSPGLFSYELTAPRYLSIRRLLTFMLTDLDRYLGLHGRIEKRKTECYILTSQKSIDEKANSMAGLAPGRKKSKGRMEVWQDENHTIKFFREVPFRLFVRDLNDSRLQWPCKPIILDETGYTGNISLDLPTSARQDMTLLKNVLLSRGFKLENSVRTMDVFVLKEENVNN